MQSFQLPDWIAPWVKTTGSKIISKEPGHKGYMRMVIELARLNFTNGLPHEQGGPFAAAVVHKASGAILSVGVNRVIPLQTSTAHAEIVALARAQQSIGSFTLRVQKEDENIRPYILYTSAQMCAMCFGAVCWSGIGEVVYGAKAEDTERLTGFDEGPIHPNWQAELEARDIKVTGPLLSKEANKVLEDYKNQDHIIYAG